MILSDAERAKGFVRPVRRSYIHIGRRPKHSLRDLTLTEHTDYDKYNYIKYETYPHNDSAVVGRFWTQEQLDSGCKTVTTMAQVLAETYARDPNFYGGTFWCPCGKHFPVSEFVWDGTDIVVGS